MPQTRKISVFLTLISIALTWLSLFGVRAAALLLRATGSQLSAELALPVRILQPAGAVALVASAFAGTLLLILVQTIKLRQEMRLLLLSGYLFLLALCTCLVLMVFTLQVRVLLFPILPTIAPPP